MAPDCGNGSGLSSTAFTTLKIAVLAPMPRVRIMSADSANPGLFRRARSDWRREFMADGAAARRAPIAELSFQRIIGSWAAVPVRPWDAYVPPPASTRMDARGRVVVRSGTIQEVTHGPYRLSHAAVFE